MRTSASVNPAMLMAVGLIAVFYFALRLSDKRIALNQRTVARARQNTTADTMVSESSENSVLTSTKPTA